MYIYTHVCNVHIYTIHFILLLLLLLLVNVFMYTYVDREEEEEGIERGEEVTPVLQ